MRRSKHQLTSGEDLFVGIDLHKNRWHVTVRTFDVEVFSASISGNWEALQRVLARYAGCQMQAVYEGVSYLPPETLYSLSLMSQSQGGQYNTSSQ